MTEILRIIAKAGGIEILKALKDSELSWTELLKKSGQNSHTLSVRTKEFIEHGLIIEKLSPIPNSPRKRKVYALSPAGKRILKLIEEIERVCREGILAEELKQSEPDVLESA
jgi:DNA-binding HxlR family transcriptional regulator